MPFTFSHPAIVLPFLRVKREQVCMSALIVSSMIPDFQYFILMQLSGRFSHSFAGVFLFDLPVALATLFIFHLLVKKPFIDSLPLYVRSRLEPLKDFDFLAYCKKHVIALLICILLGTVSHILWDGFTHRDGLFVDFFQGVFKKAIHGVPVFRCLQHISTVIGAVAMLFVFHKMPKQYSSAHNDSLRFWITAGIIFTISLAIRISFGIDYFGNLVVALISSSMLGIILASLFIKLKVNKT